MGPGKPAGAEPLDAVLVGASGCGHTLKHYGEILKSPEPQPASGSTPEAAHSKSEADATVITASPADFAAQVADIQEFLDRVGLAEDFVQALQPLRHEDGAAASAERPLRLAYHDACHMLHGQGIRDQPRQLLRRTRLCRGVPA